MTISANSVVAVNEDQVVANLDESLVILNLKNGVYYGVEDVARLIWQLLDRPRSVQELSDAVLAEYEVAPERCVEDVMELVQDFVTHGLVRVDE